MELASVLLARALAWVEPVDLNQGGHLFYPDLVKALVERYSFQKVPQKLEDFDESKGITFAAGKWGDTVIDQLVLYTYGIMIDTRASTKVSQLILEEALEWGAKHLGLAYRPAMIKRWQYASQVTFITKVPLLSAHRAFEDLAHSMTEIIQGGLGEHLEYDVTALVIDYDQLKRKHPLGRFSIQRRENTPFSENKFFSDAPLPTELHIRLLEKFEADLSRK